MSRSPTDRADPHRADTHKADPWRAIVTVAQIPDTGLHREIEADAPTRATMAEVAGVREILSAQASFELMPKSGGRVQVTGEVRGKIGQNCVVTLDPIENDIAEHVDLMFAPPDRMPSLASTADAVVTADGDVPDSPEPIDNGIIDLGRLATDVLFLAIDPYPRKPGAVFEPEIVAVDPEDHPFAALKALQADPEAADPKRPRRK